MPNNEDRPPSGERKVVWIDDSHIMPLPVPDDTLLSLDNVARMFRVSRLALRYYEFRGLIKRRHRIGGTRAYGWADCDRIAFIIKCRRADIAHREIIALIKAVDDMSDRAQKRGQEQCLALIEGLVRRRRPLDDGIAELHHLYTLLCTKSADPQGGADQP